jgi:hypothetical protein
METKLKLKNYKIGLIEYENLLRLKKMILTSDRIFICFGNKKEGKKAELELKKHSERFSRQQKY